MRGVLVSQQPRLCRFLLHAICGSPQGRPWRRPEPASRARAANGNGRPSFPRIWFPRARPQPPTPPRDDRLGTLHVLRANHGRRSRGTRFEALFDDISRDEIALRGLGRTRLPGHHRLIPRGHPSGHVSRTHASQRCAHCAQSQEPDDTARRPRALRVASPVEILNTAASPGRGRRKHATEQA